MLHTQLDSGALLICRTDDTPLFRATARLSGAAEGVSVQLSATPLDGDFLEFTLTVTPETEALVEGVHLDLTPTAEAAATLSGDAAVLTLGARLSASCGARKLSDLLGSGEGTATLDGMGVVLATPGGGGSLLVGVAGPCPDFTETALTAGTVSFVHRPRRLLSRATEYTVAVGIADDPFALLEGYGGVLARHCRPLSPVPTGWNSWDYYQAAFTMEDLRAEMAALNTSPLRGRLRYFCLDMGWENAWGDWRPNRKFPDSPARIADEIRQAGFEPGIWTAPLQAGIWVPWTRGRRDMFLRGESGDPLVVSANGQSLLLDPTHPAAEEWLFATYRGLREAGFSLFKVDYIYRDYLEAIARTHAPDTGRVAVARRFLEIIREAIGGDAHLISCGAPLPAALGLADSARVSTDIHNFWGHIRNAAVEISALYWLNGRAWVNDPDFALVRSAEASDDPFLNVAHNRTPYTNPVSFWMAGDDATFAELRTWLSLVHLYGGSVFLSDSIARLNDLGLRTFDRLLESPCAPARPLDLFESTPPRLWLSEGAEGCTLGVFNWEDTKAEVVLPAGVPARAQDFWTGESRALSGAVALPPRGSLVLQW